MNWSVLVLHLCAIPFRQLHVWINKQNPMYITLLIKHNIMVVSNKETFSRPSVSITFRFLKNFLLSVNCFAAYNFHKIGNSIKIRNLTNNRRKQNWIGGKFKLIFRISFFTPKITISTSRLRLACFDNGIFNEYQNLTNINVLI